MYTRYYDDNTGDFVDNPYLKFLVNERKLKLKYDNKWYDFIIKEVNEDSETHTYSYSAEALHINELASNGFKITFDDELENNVGTVEELAKEVIKDTDWKIAPDSELIQEKQEEPLFILTLKEQIKAQNSLDNSEITIPAKKDILVFYSCLNEKKSYFQFLYREDGQYQVNDNYIISNSEVYYINEVSFQGDLPSFAESAGSSPADFRGERYIRNPIVKRDKLTDTIVTEYLDTTDNEKVYISSTTEYLSPITVKNFITNPKEYIGNDGWFSNTEKKPFPDFYPALNYELPLEPQLKESRQYLKTTLGVSQLLWNSGLIDSRTAFVKNGIALGEKFSFRYKGNLLNQNNLTPLVGNELKIFVSFYTLENGQVILGDRIFNFENFSSEQDGYLLSTAIAERALTYRELLKQKVGIFFQQVSGEATYYFSDIQLFKYQTSENTQIFPETTPKATYYTEYSGYKPNIERNKNIKDKQEISYCLSEQEIPKNYQLIYDNKYTKKRSIKISKSNRFNILQELCEVFECWVEFEIKHDPITGKILRDSSGREEKWIRFKKYITKDNFSGFKYGINLNSIKRTIDSNKIVSKIIVEDNTNEFAKDGYCTIARAKDNPSGETFLYNFKHYYTQGLLNYQEVMNDLYNKNDNLGYIGYYSELKRINKDRNYILEKVSSLSLSINHLKALTQSYSLIEAESNEALLKAEQELNEYHEGFTYDSYLKKELNMTEEKKKKVDEYLKLDPMIVEEVTTITVLREKAKSSKELRTKYETALINSEKEYQDFLDQLDLIQKEKDIINEAFYSKYSRFIQEGSWLEEDYIDDNLYYYDAESTLNTSADPLITYDIKVIEVSEIEGLQNYRFDIGDITTIEDTEFFGWTFIDGIQTPVKQQIIISEVAFDLDNPENNSITVQNYKTRFEDLFQRISATTAQLKYNSGGYDKAAGVILPNGTLSHDVLQNSLAQNSFVISNATDQSVVWDSNGILVSSPKTPNSLIRIVNGGIYLSRDGGSNWSSAITGYGINADYLNAGQIDTSLIRIMNGSFPTFKWDTYGISAYSFVDGQGGPSSIDYSKFIRFDQYGIYGMLGADSLATSLEDIKNKANFGLTWDGFFLKNLSENNMVSISSKDDIQVLKKTEKGYIERVKIGNISDNYIENYGLKISDNNGLPILETEINGTLKLKKSLAIQSSDNNYNINLGYLDAIKKDSTNIHEVFNANNKFVVYEDGSINAAEGKFEGTIIATGGKIGNMTIGEVEQGIENNKSVKIVAKQGINFYIDSEGNKDKDFLELEVQLNGIELESENQIVWKKIVNNQWVECTPYGQKFLVKYSDTIFTNNVAYFKVQVSVREKIYEDFCTISKISDGTAPIILTIQTLTGNIYINNNINDKLIAKVLKDGVDITERYKNKNLFSWEKYDKEGSKDIVWTNNHQNIENIVEITHLDIDQKATFSCKVQLD